MKPINLKIKAFGPYMEQVEIDFLRLGAGGIFLITGPTGCGKTTILDAMCYALYGKASGTLRRDSKALRCTIADDDTTTEVRFVFAIGEQQYVFERILTCKTIHKRNGETEIKELVEASCSRLENDIAAPLCKNSDVEKKAEEILGFSHEQFSQVIILPQGEFRKLLLSGSEQKSKILETLFGTSKWQTLDYILKNKTEELRIKAAKLRTQRETFLASESAENTDILKAKSEQMQLKLYELKSSVQNAKEYLGIINTAFSSAEKIDNQFIELEIKQNQLNLLHEKQEENLLLKQRLFDARRADGIFGSFSIFKQAVNEKERISKQYIVAKKEADEADEKYAQIQYKINDLPNLIQKSDELKERISKNEDFIRDVSRIVKEKSKLDAVIKAEANSLQKSNVLKERLFEINKKIELINEKFDENAIHRLANELKEGAPCPICGSTSHPNPAKMNDGGDVAFDDKRKEFIEEQNKITEEIEENAAELSRINAQKSEHTAVMNEILNRLPQKLQGEKLPDEKSIQTAFSKLKVEFEDNKKNIEKIQTDEKNFLQGKNITSTKRDTFFSALQVANDHENQAKEAYQKQAVEYGFTLDNDIESLHLNQTQKSEMEAKITAYENTKAGLTHTVTDLKKALTPAIRPNMVELTQKRDEAVSYLTQSESQTEATNQELSRIDKVIKKLETIEKEGFESEKELSKYDRLYRLIHGENMLKIPFHTYVVSLMLDDVIAYSNDYLHTLSRGQYILKRTEESGKGRGFKGLELAVLDAFRGGERDVSTLSGGEMFLASLALAFGLAQAVQGYSGGIRLDSIFIDEGFGTLDEDTLETAMQALSQIRSSGRLIGIISHVNELKSRISTRIEISRSQDGTSLIEIRD